MKKRRNDRAMERTSGGKIGGEVGGWFVNRLMDGWTNGRMDLIF